MAEQIVSPGVFTRENDQSFITQQPVEVGAAIVGPAVKGPVEIPTLVTSYSEYVNKFGSTFVSGGQVYSFLTGNSAYNYFQNGGNTLLVTRVANGTFTSATASIAYTSVALTGGSTAQAFKLKTISEGTIMNSEVHLQYFRNDDGQYSFRLKTISRYYYGTEDNYQQLDGKSHLQIQDQVHLIF